MKRITNLLDEATVLGMVEIKSRRCGNTTRMIDLAVQLLFEGHKLKVIDHADGNFASWYLFDMLLNRLYREHPEQMTHNNVDIDKGNRIIQFR